MHKRISLALVCLTVAGCGGGGADPGKLAPVSGKVTLDGKPLAGATVTFTGRGETKGSGAFGFTDGEGKYTLEHRSNKRGINPGEYMVSFSRLTMPDGSPIPEGKTGADVDAVESVPEKHTYDGQQAAAVPTNTATVGEDGATLDFELTSE